MIDKKLKFFLETLTQKSKSKFYFDFNVIKKEEERFVVDKTNSIFGKDNDYGIKIRVFDNSKFLEFGTSNLDFENIESNFLSLLQKAEENQKNIKKNEIVKLVLDKKITKKNYQKKFENLNIKNIESKFKKIKDNFLKIDNNIVNLKIIIRQTIEENFFINKYKILYQKIPISLFAIIGFVKTKTGIKEIFIASSGIDYLIIDKKIAEFKKEFKFKIKAIKISKKLKGGKYKVILSNKLSGLLAHESFGHGMEADTMIKNRALATKFLNKKISNKEVSIMDYGNISGCHGSIFFDSEGNKSEKTYLVKNGILKNPISCLYSNSKLKKSKSKISCNSRFENYDHKNYVRMTNTYFEKGKSKVDEMFKSIENGIYIISSSGGMEDPKSWGVQIQGCLGQKIKNGKLVNEFYDGFTFTGFLPDIMKNISGVGNDLLLEDIGFCGKGHKEWVRVSSGGPHLKIDEVILG
jgi:TldD protein